MRSGQCTASSQQQGGGQELGRTKHVVAVSVKPLVRAVPHRHADDGLVGAGADELQGVVPSGQRARQGLERMAGQPSVAAGSAARRRCALACLLRKIWWCLTGQTAPVVPARRWPGRTRLKLVARPVEEALTPSAHCSACSTALLPLPLVPDTKVTCCRGCASRGAIPQGRVKRLNQVRSRGAKPALEQLSWPLEPHPQKCVH